MCATASRSCASPARPMCCRAPASAASRWSASTPRRWRSKSIASATATCSTTVLGRDFQRNLDRYDIDRLTEERGSQVWKGEMAVEQTLNTDVTTAFPVDQAIGTLSPGVYVHGGARRGRAQATIRRARDAMVHRLRSRPHRVLRQRRHPRLRAFARDHAAAGHGRGPAAVARQRGARDASAPATPATCSSKPSWRAARARCRRRCWSRATPRATTPS